MPMTPVNPADPKGSTPVPDPTLLTSQALSVAIESLKDLIHAEIHGRAAVVDQRFASMEIANGLLQQIFDSQPKIIDDKIGNLQTLHEEKFRSIEVQFLERDTRTETTARDSKVAVDAALSAAKEAVGEQNKSSALAIAKSEAATTKQIDQMGTLVGTTTSGLNDKIADVKDRITRIESNSIGHREGFTTTTAIVGIAIGAIGLLFGYGLTSRTNPAPAPVVAVIPSVVDTQQSAQIAALTRLLEQHLTPPASR